MKLVYICSPYRADTAEGMEDNRQSAIKACEHAYSFGRMIGEMVVPITPLVNFPYLDENNVEDREQALKAGLAFLSRCDEVWVAGDHVSEGMRGEIRAAVRTGKPVLSLGLEQEKIQDAIFDMLPMLDDKSCFKSSNQSDYKGQLLILKPSALAPWAKEPENQLWIAKNGFGTSPDARGRAVYAKSLFDGEDARWERNDFYGIANPEKLPDWARNRIDELQNDNEMEEIEV